MSLTRKIAYNTIIQFAGKAVSVFLGVITIAILTRYLGQTGFGQYSTIMAYLQFFAILVDLGLQITIVRLIADPKYNQNKIVNNIFTLRFFSALIFLGFAPVIVLLFPYDNIIKLGIAIASLSYFFSSMSMIIIGLFQKYLKMGKVVIAELAGRIVLLVLVILIAFYNQGLLLIMWAVVANGLIIFILNYFFVQKYIKIKFAFDWNIWLKILETTWPIAVSIAFNLVYFKADTIILSLIRSQAEVGIYNAPYRVLEILTNFIYMFMGIMFPVLTLHWSEKNWPKFKQTFQQAFNFLIILSVPMVFGTMFIAKDLMILIAGPDFAESSLVLKIIIFATAIIFINSLFGYTIVVINKQKQMVWAYIIVAIVALIGYLILIPIYGYVGAAIFTVISELLIFIFNFIVTLKTIKFLPNLLIIVKTITASLIMSFFLYLGQNQNIFFLIGGALIVYLLALYLVKGFSKEFVLEILKNRSVPKPEKINGN